MIEEKLHVLIKEVSSSNINAKIFKSKLRNFKTAFIYTHLYINIKYLYFFSDKFANKLTLQKIAAASGRLKRQSRKDFLFAIPCKLFSYIIAHTIAVKMIYPGSVSVISWAIGRTLLLLLYIYTHTSLYYLRSFCITMSKAQHYRREE